MPSQSSLLGAAGEHYVVCQLLRRGYPGCLGHEVIANHAIFPGFTSEAAMAHSPAHDHPLPS